MYLGTLVRERNITVFAFIMECNSEVGSLSQNDTGSSTASSVRFREDISSEEQSLLQVLERGISETTEENIAFGKEISSLLSQLNLELQFLPSDIREGLQKIALILRFVKLSDLDDVSLSIVSERKKIEEKKRQHEEKQLSLLYDHLYRKYSIFSRKLNHLQEAVSSLECFLENAQKEQEDTDCDKMSLSIKLNEYQQTMENLEADLEDMNIQDLYPQEILEKYHKYLETLGELAELKEYLSQYGDLPPNLLQAKAQLEVKRKEYETIEKAFLKKV
ncbi:uncharacterized protein LOC128890961 [Hylaeus anthracinus]|uniref:uncharacterized protein LOC128883287 n=1 Tax=Hylaeus volcanicus TaxID=313075 RepID=UPI0023B811C8|nr:uncharacterized protein LOC128883287 [Hylaeus volcanicus]XP_054005990.1 uncharacterized protein LOC128890961 [Hylaeus anthracinus]